MRPKLVFTPQSSPSYAPLGPAVLSAVAKSALPGLAVEFLDLNLLAWERAAALVEGGPECLLFMRGRMGDFFDREQYEHHAEAWAAIDATITRWSVKVKRRLAGDSTDPELSGLLLEMTGALLSEDPDLLGFSFFSLGQLPWILALAQNAAKLKGENASPLLVIGGASSTAVDAEELLLASPFLDAMVLGEGDEPFTLLCRGTPLAQIPGLARVEGGRVVKNPRPKPWSMSDSPDPDFSGFDLARYLNPLPVLPVLASRGCKWGRCRFCAHNATYLGGYRPLDGEAVAEGLERLKARYGASHFYFADLYVDAPELAELSRALLARGVEVNFHVLGRPTAEHTPELFELAARAGLRWISWGVESASQAMLEIAGKGTRAEEVEAVLAASRKAGISNLAMMIFGLPTSSDEELEKTFAFLERVYPDIDAMTASAFALFANAPFGKNPERYSLKALEAQEELKVGEAPIHSRRLDFAEVTGEGTARPPRGQVETARWSSRRRWLGEVPFMEGLPCEHYLLYASHGKN